MSTTESTDFVTPSLDEMIWTMPLADVEDELIVLWTRANPKATGEDALAHLRGFMKQNLGRAVR